jgi:hypothetical protein
MKVVINSFSGEFDVSDIAFEMLLHVKGIEFQKKHDSYFDLKGNCLSKLQFIQNRCDVDLVKVVETLGKSANSSRSTLKIIEIPDDVEFKIEEFEGIEWIVEIHRIWI